MILVFWFAARARPLSVVRSSVGWFVPFALCGVAGRTQTVAFFAVVVVVVVVGADNRTDGRKGEITTLLSRLYSQK